MSTSSESEKVDVGRSIDSEQQEQMWAEQIDKCESTMLTSLFRMYTVLFEQYDRIANLAREAFNDGTLVWLGLSQKSLKTSQDDVKKWQLRVFETFNRSANVVELFQRVADFRKCVEQVHKDTETGVWKLEEAGDLDLALQRLFLIKVDNLDTRKKVIDTQCQSLCQEIEFQQEKLRPLSYEIVRKKYGHVFTKKPGDRITVAQDIVETTRREIAKEALCFYNNLHYHCRYIMKEQWKIFRDGNEDGFYEHWDSSKLGQQHKRFNEKATSKYIPSERTLRKFERGLGTVVSDVKIFQQDLPRRIKGLEFQRWSVSQELARLLTEVEKLNGCIEHNVKDMEDRIRPYRVKMALFKNVVDVRRDRKGKNKPTADGKKNHSEDEGSSSSSDGEAQVQPAREKLGGYETDIELCKLLVDIAKKLSKDEETSDGALRMEPPREDLKDLEANVKICKLLPDIEKKLNLNEETSAKED